MSREGEIHFVAPDRRIAVTTPHRHLDAMVESCRAAGEAETGGILIGYYNDARDRAIVSSVTGPPSDSSAGYRAFSRGVSGLQRLIDRAWRRRRYYIGEWHYHPAASADPSERDLGQMMEIASDRRRQCARPVLVVVGGVLGGAPIYSVSVVGPQGTISLNSEADMPAE